MSLDSLHQISSVFVSFTHVNRSDQVYLASKIGENSNLGRFKRDNGNVHRAAANIIASKSRAARGSVCNVLLSRRTPLVSGQMLRANPTPTQSIHVISTSGKYPHLSNRRSVAVIFRWRRSNIINAMVQYATAAIANRLNIKPPSRISEVSSSNGTCWTIEDAIARLCVSVAREVELFASSGNRKLRCCGSCCFGIASGAWQGLSGVS